MKRFIFIAAISLLSACSFVKHDTPPKAESTVKVVLYNGHGTGVHIGDGYVVTAAHVVGTNLNVSLKKTDGTDQPGQVLWVNKEYDVALIKTTPTMAASPLQCVVPTVGSNISAYGNPLKLEFIHTYGKVAGKEIELEAWKKVIPVDMVIIPGMSGGPVFDAQDRVVGIGVGVVTYATGLTGVGMMVSGKTICDLMNRG